MILAVIGKFCVELLVELLRSRQLKVVIVMLLDLDIIVPISIAPYFL